ncbi:MAG: NUDIX hydrolase [Propionibacteriaceae bacterium]|jgi:ADP-ribose pyrophosphatase|nr:NUDIX hydrolase [Propionibacteriaceae bacterium]
MSEALPGRTYSGDALADTVTPVWPARVTAQLDGRVTSYVSELVTAPSGETLRREWLRHPGAVAVIAYDDQGRIAVVDQYRHPAGFTLIEPPAGLLDLAGEAALLAAQRELAEEVQLQAADWRVLVDTFTSPGSSQEAIRVFLARDLAPAPPPEGFVLEGEEKQMGVGWADLAETVDHIFAGRLQCPTLVAGVLALWAAVTGDRLDALRPADAPWTARQTKLDRDEATKKQPRSNQLRQSNLSTRA